jgi:phosphate transport system substrate-binding protein
MTSASLDFGRRRLLRSIGAVGLGIATGAGAGEPPVNPAVADPALTFVGRLPTYRAREAVKGTVVLWGHGSFKRDFMGPLVKDWMTGLRRHQPGIELDYRMYGTASAISALLTGAGNLALLGEEISPSAATAFRRAKGYPPTGIEVATGSLDVNFFDYAHMIFVHRDNPVRGLTLAQLDAVFGAEHRRGRRNIRRWGELGLTGEWSDAKIQPYAWKIDEDFALFFREAVLEGSHRWNEATREYVHVVRLDGTQYDHGQQILDALAKDRFGIAVSNVRYANPQVRQVPLARRDDGPFVTASPASLISQEFPLVRIIPAYVDKAPAGRVEPAPREFLRYVLSREGQSALIARSGYLPLGERQIAAQLAKLA